MARVLASLGVRKIRLTGGEPLARRGVEGLVRELSGLGGIEEVVMTTNGVLLARQARILREAGLSRLNVSLDTLRPGRFRRIALSGDHEDVWAGIDAALLAGFSPLKLNVVVMGGVNDDELLDFVDLAKDRPLEVRFIEYMPFTRNGWPAASFVPCHVMGERIAERYSLTQCVRGAGSVASTYRIEGFAGSVGFISPMSSHFCDDCNRLRIMADGTIKACLFGPPSGGLRGPLRDGTDDAGIADAIRLALSFKAAAHPPLVKLAGREDQSMARIGG